MADQYIYVMENLTKKLGDRIILKDVSLSFFPGAKIGVLGRNGAGKSTILRIMAGRDTEFDGRVQLAKGYTVGLFDQEPKLDPTKDVRGNVMEGVKAITDLLKRFDEISQKFGEPMSDAEMDKLLAEQAKLQDEIEAKDAWDVDRRVEIAMEAMECPPDDAGVTKLSGGEKRRVALCRLLLESPDLLLLDEPTNHLDAASVAWLERFLGEYKGTVVAVTHDRYFLDNVAEWILEIDRGRAIPYKGNYSGWLQQKADRLKLEEKKESARQKTLKRELEWVQTSPKARSTKNKARLAAYERMAAEAEEARDEEFEMVIPPGPHLGQRVIEVDGLTKSFGDKTLFENLSFRIPPAAIVGVLGPNGAGKTTLFRILTGEIKPDKGEVRIGDTVKLGYIDQTRESLSATKNVWEEISGGLEFFDIGRKRINTRAYCAQFNFKGTEQLKRVADLSGGERNRVQLAKLFRQGLNVIMLDEPTNDLDVDTLRAMEEAVQHFAGCVIVTSHDRWFLDRLATHILAFEGEGQVYWCEGNYQVYEAGRRERLGQDADTPHRIKYKKLG